MARKRKPKICGALDMQKELEELFFGAKNAGNLKEAGYIAQVWSSLENHAASERESNKEERTALDDLVDILENMRSKYNNETKVKENEED